MKGLPKLLAIAVGVMVFAGGLPNTCQANGYEEKAGKIAADVLVYRPAGIILTVGGSALFLVALPFSAIVGGTKHTAKTLVATPFNFTFRRPVGTDLRDYADGYWY